MRTRVLLYIEENYDNREPPTNGRIYPVSYTHLDVYKRQNQYLQNVLPEITHSGLYCLPMTLHFIIKKTLRTYENYSTELCAKHARYYASGRSPIYFVNI